MHGVGGSPIISFYRLTLVIGIVQIFNHLDPAFDISRVCIKIPSTWEGLKACKILQSTGTTTLATTLFVIEQAALAGEVGCHYIAPYVNELRVHFDAGYVVFVSTPVVHYTRAAFSNLVTTKK